MSLKTTKKDVVSAYAVTICVGYGKLPHLLSTSHPIAYTHGVYGWNADVYDVDTFTAIVTGYRPFGNIKPSQGLIEKYEGLAKEVSQKQIRDLLLQFGREAWEELRQEELKQKEV